MLEMSFCCERGVVGQEKKRKSSDICDRVLISHVLSCTFDIKIFEALEICLGYEPSLSEVDM